jgi:hypothetical protein
METLIQLLVALGVGGLITKGIDKWTESRKNSKHDDTTLKLAEVSEDARRLMRVEEQANNLFAELREVEKENNQLQVKASTLEFRLEEALRREEALKIELAENVRYINEKPKMRMLLSDALLIFRAMEDKAPIEQIKELVGRVSTEITRIDREE